MLFINSVKWRNFVVWHLGWNSRNIPLGFIF